MKKIQSVESYIERYPSWQNALSRLRRLAQSTGLREEIKWSSPVYTLDHKNVFGIGAFKSHVGIWFYQGVFLSDPEKCLVNAQDGKTRALRQMRFQSEEEMNDRVILSYMEEAVKNQKKGKVLKPEKPGSVNVPVELDRALQADPKLQENFRSITPYKQREFAEYIREAKQDSTRQKRLEKIIPLIRTQTGLNDKFRKS